MRQKQPRQSIKQQRKNQQKQKMTMKREELNLKRRRLAECPRIVSVIELCKDTNASDFEYKLTAVENSKLRFKVFKPQSMTEILDCGLVSDYVIFLFSADPEIPDFGHEIVKLLKLQGLSNVAGVIQQFENISKSEQGNVRKLVVDFMEHHFPGETKVYPDVSIDAFVRNISPTIPNGVQWRDKYAYLVADSVEFSPENGEKGTLAVTGYVRGATLSANRLVHLPNYGDFQLSHIKVLSAKQHASSDMEVDQGLIHEPQLDKQENLVLANTVDSMDAEQTWPTDEEIVLLQGQNAEGSNLKKVPKGTSSYQAAWIVEDEDEADQEDEGEDEKMSQNEDFSFFKAKEEEEEEEFEDLDVNGEKTEGIEEDEEMEYDEDKEAVDYQAYLDQKSHLEFPDEVDTPQDIPARVRFARYRGLKSFRTSPWDPYENLPAEYGKIFQFRDFKRLKNQVLKQSNGADGVCAGSKCILYIKDVPRAILDSIPENSPFYVYSLLPHEHKLSVQHFSFSCESEEPIKSKALLYVSIGFRKFLVKPIWSLNTRGGTNDVHQFQRFMTKEGIGSFLGPIQILSVPVLCFKVPDMQNIDLDEPQNEEGNLEMVPVTSNLEYCGQGMSLPPSPTRINAKRVILTGYPFKIHARSSVIRFMFFNPEDISYFRPIQLVTKAGIKGHIKCSVGTHGYMKVVFEKPISAQDTICLNLYKRVYGKWCVGAKTN